MKKKNTKAEVAKVGKKNVFYWIDVIKRSILKCKYCDDETTDWDFLPSSTTRRRKDGNKDMTYYNTMSGKYPVLWLLVYHVIECTLYICFVCLQTIPSKIISTIRNEIKHPMVCIRINSMFRLEFFSTSDDSLWFHNFEWKFCIELDKQSSTRQFPFSGKCVCVCIISIHAIWILWIECVG